MPISRFKAKLWNRLYWLRFNFLKFRLKHASTLIIFLFISLIGLSFYFTPDFQAVLAPYFLTGDRASDLKTVFITLGGALVGAGAISFSLVMFALQVNIERMPHGLFWRFSTDKRVIIAFTVIFFLAAGVASLSLFVEPSTVAFSIVSAVWAAIIIISLVIYAYRRTLALINPIKQLTRIIDDARTEIRLWRKRGERARVLFTPVEEENEPPRDSRFDTTHDIALAAYFQSNPHWTLESKKAVDHAISFARRYAEYGDYTVSRNALNVIVEINALYIQAKGKTFFSDSLLMRNPFSTDGFINSTLEQLRQNLSIGFSRRDEQQIEQTLNAFAKVAILYTDIDYSNIENSKQHANLAAAYLSEGVQSALRHGFTDVVMQGLRWMGQTAAVMLTKATPKEITTLVKDIGLISCGGIISEKTRPVTLTGVQQLTMLTMLLFKTKNRDIGFAAKQIKSNISMISKILLELPDTPLASLHSSNLAPYYSGTSTDTLQSSLTNLTNALINADADNEDAQGVMRNIEEWADGLYQTEKELLLLAIEKRSHFTFDIVHWIAHISKLLLALSKAEACPDYLQEKLEGHALWLFSTLSWIKDDENTIAFVEHYDITETLFEIAFEARRRECFEFSEKARELLVGWAFKAGKHTTGWSVLETSIYALATLALDSGSELETNRLKNTVRQRLDGGIIDQEKRDSTARSIRERAATLYRQGRLLSRIDAAMGHQNRDKTKELLEEIANILSPDTADDPIDIAIF